MATENRKVPQEMEIQLEGDGVRTSHLLDNIFWIAIFNALHFFQLSTPSPIA